MAPWYEAPWYDPGSLPAQHMTMPMPAQGAAIEPVVLDPPGHDCRGDLGTPRPHGLRHRVPQHRSRRGASCGRWHAAVHGAPQSVDVGAGEWRYAYFAEPDGNYVALVEARY